VDTASRSVSDGRYSSDCDAPQFTHNKRTYRHIHTLWYNDVNSKRITHKLLNVWFIYNGQTGVQSNFSAGARFSTSFDFILMTKCTIIISEHTATAWYINDQTSQKFTRSRFED